MDNWVNGQEPGIDDSTLFTNKLDAVAIGECADEDLSVTHGVSGVLIR